MDKQTELLVILVEECAEVQQAAMKLLRFGLDACNPIDDKLNIDQFREELGDLQCMIDMVVEQGIAEKGELQRYADKKREKLRIWSSFG